MARDTYKYHFKKGNKIVHTGITNDLEWREQEHKEAFGESGHIKKGRLRDDSRRRPEMGKRTSKKGKA